MAAIETFGVVPATLSRYIGKYVPATNSEPTEAQATELILDAAAEWSGVLYRKGVIAESLVIDTTSISYRLSQKWIAMKAAYSVLVMRERMTPEIAQNYKEELAITRNAVIANAAELADGQDVSDGAPDLPDTQYTRRRQIARNVGNQSIAQRLAWEGKI